MNSLSYNIAAVERDTGLTKDVLRIWERRYGFPLPGRDSNGERVYPAEQVERLRLIKRLMDQGHRPGKLIAAPVDELTLLAPRRVNLVRVESDLIDDSLIEELLLLIKQHDISAFVGALQQRLSREGMQRFVHNIVAPLTDRVGEAWEAGRIEIFEEHLFTELTKRVMRQAIASLPRGNSVPGSPRVLLTSVPDEQHLLGLLMVEALFALEGADCIPLGTQMPLPEIARAAEAHRADIVALSFSVAFPARRVTPILQQLRQILPAEIELWVGGGGALRIIPPEGVFRLASLEQSLDALAEWRRNHGLR